MKCTFNTGLGRPRGAASYAVQTEDPALNTLTGFSADPVPEVPLGGDLVRDLSAHLTLEISVAQIGSVFWETVHAVCGRRNRITNTVVVRQRKNLIADQGTGREDKSQEHCLLGLRPCGCSLGLKPRAGLGLHCSVVLNELHTTSTMMFFLLCSHNHDLLIFWLSQSRISSPVKKNFVEVMPLDVKPSRSSLA